jgi:hypothetical protein
MRREMSRGARRGRTSHSYQPPPEPTLAGTILGLVFVALALLGLFVIARFVVGVMG